MDPNFFRRETKNEAHIEDVGGNVKERCNKNTS